MAFLKNIHDDVRIAINVNAVPNSLEKYNKIY